MSSAGEGLFNKTMADSAAHPVAAYNGEMTAPTNANQTQASGQAATTSGAGQGQVALARGLRFQAPATALASARRTSTAQPLTAT
jgi:hypothetical protein